MNLQHIQFKSLNQKELGILLDWAAQEGWNPGINDAEAFWQTDRGGFLGCFLDEEMIAAGSIVSYNRMLGFMGLFIVRPPYRGNGLGEKLWYLRRGRLQDRLHPGAAIGMDGVVAMQPFYQRGGFVPAFRDERYERIGEAFELHSHVRKLVEEDFVPLCHYDQRCFGAGRVSFLKSWLTLPTHQTFVFTQGDQIEGYAVVRKALQGYKIGPLFANDFEKAEALYQACLNTAQGEPVYLDIPVINEAAVALIKKYEAKYVFECARMYNGTPPPVEINQVFGITTFELG